MKNTVLLIIGAVLLVLVLSGISTYNSLNTSQQSVSKQWANVESDYQRRADLVPNLVATVKGSSQFEQETLTKVIEARAAATSIKIDASNLDEESIKKFQSVQDGLGSALSRLIAVSESYPDIKSAQAYRDLMVQLEGTENRISVSRKDFNSAVAGYNGKVGSFPTLIIAKLFGFNSKGYFSATSGSDVAPAVKF